MATCNDCVHVEVCKFKDLPAPLSIGYLKTEAGTYINVNHIASIREMENWE